MTERVNAMERTGMNLPASESAAVLEEAAVPETATEQTKPQQTSSFFHEASRKSFTVTLHFKETGETLEDKLKRAIIRDVMAGSV